MVDDPSPMVSQGVDSSQNLSTVKLELVQENY